MRYADVCSCRRTDRAANRLWSSANRWRVAIGRNQNAIGRRLLLGRHQERHATVVGVVAEHVSRSCLRATPHGVFPLAQSAFTSFRPVAAIRTTTTPASVVAGVRHAIDAAASGVFLANAAPFASFHDSVVAQPRLHAFLLLIFAVSAALLAGVGLFATMATLVRQRTHEFGVRMALGATTGEVASFMMRRACTLAVGGVSVGLAIALVTNRLLSSLLYGVAPTDPITLLGVGVLLLVIGLAATFVPARASSTDRSGNRPALRGLDRDVRVLRNRSPILDVHRIALFYTVDP